MRFLSTIVFTSLFLIVLGVYWYLESPKPVKQRKGMSAPVKAMDRIQPALEQTSMKLLPIDEEDNIAKVQIQNLHKNESFTFERVDQGWEITDPVQYAADKLIVEGLVTALTVSNKARRLVPEKDWAEYGLDKPSFKIGIETQKKQERFYLYLGDPTPVGDFIFAKWEDEKEYFLLNANFKKAFDKSLYALRLKSVFRISGQEVTKIHIRTTTGDYEITDYEGQWFWMEPIPILGEKIAEGHVMEILSRLHDLYIKDFLDEETRSKRELGISLLGASISLWIGEKKAVKLYLGSEVTTRDSYYGMLEDEDVFFLVARPNIRELFERMEVLANESGKRHFSSTSTGI